MTSPAHPDRPTPPSVREIAALTARLRELSARGRDVDEADRAAFLVDKDALLARIPHAATDGRAPHIHAAIIDRSEPPATVDGVVDLDRPWTTQGTTRDTAHAVAIDPGPAGSMLWVTVAEADQQEQRRDQLARWHTDDQADHQDDSDRDAATPGTDAGGQVWVCDDAPGLP
ncbi:MAG: hypothetical protein J0I49_30195 [Pseudonocardia sp.]|uniref:hypothetical protein n=1 Tax=Pseudonocardia sp. TaxID=60912 RepID=UPI001AC12F37|nr:hypothetical protein [Pseudonocardia sp.]MBN9102337.1 hypothetical protein [Pseudonocardia sp.]